VSESFPPIPLFPGNPYNWHLFQPKFSGWGESCPHPWRKDCGLNSELLRSTPKTISSWEDQISGILKQGTVLLSIGDDLLRLLLSLTENTLFTLGI